MNKPFTARFRLLRWGDTIALVEQSMTQESDPDLLPWVGSYVMTRAYELLPPSEEKTAAVVSITGHCEEVTDGEDYSIEVCAPVIVVFPDEYSSRDDHVFNNRPF